MKLSVACFGLRGFGNDLLEALCRLENIEVNGIYTRKESQPLPYYPCDTIEDVARKMDAPLHYIPVKGTWGCEPADLAIVSSFHRILKREHLSCFDRVVNIHPSLLPAYRGATPTNWMIKHGERIAGLTAHLVREGIVDDGPIIAQRKVLNPYLNDNQLRKALSFSTRKMVAEIIDDYPNFKRINNLAGDGSYFPPRKDADGLARLSDFNTIDELIFHIKAFSNYPMPKLEVDEGIFVIDFERPTDSITIELANTEFDLLGYWTAGASDSEQERKVKEADPVKVLATIRQENAKAHAAILVALSQVEERLMRNRKERNNEDSRRTDYGFGVGDSDW